MAGKGTLTVRLVGDAKPLQKTLGGVGKKLGKFVAGVAAAGAAAAGVLVAKGVEAAREAQAINRITENVIRTTGGAANVTAQQVDDLSGRLQALTGVSDETIQRGSNMLLTFTNIRNELGEGNDVFDQATGLALDMSVAMGTDVKDSAIQLGKALNDPIKGVSALSRVGIQFTEQQKEQIATLVESGDTLGAQKVILDEVGKQFKGTAEAAADPMQKLSSVVGDVVEVVGVAALPILNKLGTWLGERLPAAVETAIGWVKSNLVPAFQQIKGWWDENSPAIIAVVQALWDGLRLAFDGIVASIQFVMDQWDKFKVAIGVAVAVMIPHWVALSVAATISAVKQVAAWVMTQAASVKSALVHSAQVAVMVAKWVFVGAQSLLHAGKVAAAWLIAMGPIGLVIAAVVGLVALIVANWDTIVRVTKDLWGKVKAFFTETIPAIAGTIRDGITAVVEWLIEHHPVVMLLRKAEEVWPSVRTWFAEMPGKLVSAIGDLGTLMLEKGKELIRGFIAGVKSMASQAASAVSNAIPGVGSITRGIGNLVGRIPGLADGGTAIRPGLAIVGERGPELLHMNRGATVQPLPGRGNGGPNVTVYAPNYIGDHRDLARQLEGMMATGLRRAQTLAGAT